MPFLAYHFIKSSWCTLPSKHVHKKLTNFNNSWKSYFSDSRKSFFAVRSKVSSHFPSFAPIEGFFNEHGSRSERFVVNNQVSHVKLRFQVQLNRHVGLRIFRLPPWSVLLWSWFILRFPLVHDIFDSMRYLRRRAFALRSGIAVEDSLILTLSRIQMGKNRVSGFAFQSTCGGGG